MPEIELTGSQVRDLDSLNQVILRLQGELTRAERAGMDVSGLQAKLGKAESLRSGLLREFTPGASTRKNRS